jgi:arylsulfatase A-like enzyme
VVLTLVSDHGDEFFEHGQKGHHRNLYEESVRVAWIVRAPGVPAGATLRGVAGLEDVAPTLLGLAGLPPLPEATGRNLAEHLVRGEPVPGAVLMQLNQIDALRGPDWKVLLDESSRLALYYDLASDPEEKRPQLGQKAAPEKVELLLERARAAREHGDALAWQGDSEVSLDDETESRLRALGYLGTATPAARREPGGAEAVIR